MVRVRLASNIFWMYGLQGLNYLIPAILLPFLVRTLGIRQYGLIAFAQSIAQYFILATDFGFNFSATRSISINRDDDAELSRTFWTVLSIKLMLLLVCGALLVGMLVTLPRFQKNSAIFFAAYLMVIGNAIFPLWLFQGIEQMRAISIYSGLGRLFGAVLIVLLVRTPKDTLLATVLLSSGYLFAGILGIVVAIRKHVPGFYRPRIGDFRTTITESWHLFLTTAAISLYSNTNTFLVGMLAGMEQVGYFNLADKLIRAIGGVIAPLIQATYPRMVALLSESRQEALRFVWRILRVATGGGIVIGLGLAFEAGPLAHLAFASRADLLVIHLLRILALFPLLASMNYVFGTLLLIPFGIDKAQSRMLLMIGLSNVLLGLLLIPKYGALGGVTAMMITESIQVIGNVFLIRQNRIVSAEA